LFIEVTTYRRELYSSNSRKPSVVFTHDLKEDLSRRDFTINAIALTADEELVDPFNGANDLKTGILKAVGDPGERFHEDPLRLLRLIRFVARSGFKVDQPTYKAAADRVYTLTNISTERINAELDYILVAPHAVDALRLMAELGLLSFAIPLLAVQVHYDQNTPYHRFELWEHSLKTMGAVEPDVELRWAALLHDVGKPFVRREKPGRSSYVHHDRVGAVLVEMIGRHLHWSNDRLERIRELVRTHMSDDNPIRKADNAAK
jgi:putative nucleotidyltransferase with HDIG domain